MPTASRVFATPEEGSDFFETLNRSDNYQYVGGEIDIHADDLAASVGLLQAPDLPESVTAEPSFTVGEEASGVVRITLNDPTDVPDTVDELIGAGLRVSPHHVYVLAPHTQFGPADAPQNLDPLPNWAGDVATDRRNAGPDGPIVVIIDTGILPRGLTLIPRESLLHDDPDGGVTNPGAANQEIAPYVGHGTFVAGLVLKESPGARLVAIRPRGFTPTVKPGGISLKDDELAAALDRAFEIARGFGSPRVLNLSLAGPAHSGFDPSVTASRQALDIWGQADVKIVAAAGNAHSKEKHYPGAYSDVICVGALDERGQTATFSNEGDWVNTWALGVDTESWYIESANAWGVSVPAAEANRRNNAVGPWGGFARWSGTSFAAPTVAGQLAQ